MKVDLDYFSKFLSVFIESDKAYIALEDLAKHGFHINGKDNDNLLFHLGIALDNGFLGTDSKNTAFNLKDIGIERVGKEICYWHIGLRLTQNGHDFAKTLSNKAVLERLKTEFKDAPFDILFDGGKKLLEHFFKKKLDTLLAE